MDFEGVANGPYCCITWFVYAWSCDETISFRLRRKGHTIQVISYNSVRINEALLFKRIRNCLPETEKMSS